MEINAMQVKAGAGKLAHFVGHVFGRMDGRENAANLPTILTVEAGKRVAQGVEQWIFPRSSRAGPTISFHKMLDNPAANAIYRPAA